MRVLLARAVADSDREIVTAARKTGGRSAVEAALTADPGRVPTEIVVGPEGAQPMYDQEAGSPS